MNLKDQKIYRDQQTANPYRLRDEIINLPKRAQTF